jgi:hypothetical protein
MRAIPLNVPWRITVTLLASLALSGGCERSVPRPTVAAPIAAGPQETLRELKNLRSRHLYDRMNALIVPAQGHAVVQTLLAVDDFLAANNRLCDWVRDRIGIGLAQSIDQSYLSDDLGFYLCNSMNIFASEVKLLDEAIQGDTAVVSFVAAGRSPAEEARLKRIDGRWRYDPGRVVPDGFAAAFRDMARGLDELSRDLESGQIDVALLRDEREQLMNRVEAKLRRGVRLLSQARAETAGGN